MKILKFLLVDKSENWEKNKWTHKNKICQKSNHIFINNIENNSNPPKNYKKNRQNLKQSIKLKKDSNLNNRRNRQNYQKPTDLKKSLNFKKLRRLKKSLKLEKITVIVRIKKLLKLLTHSSIVDICEMWELCQIDIALIEKSTTWRKINKIAKKYPKIKNNVNTEKKNIQSDFLYPLKMFIHHNSYSNFFRFFDLPCYAMKINNLTPKVLCIIMQTVKSFSHHYTWRPSQKL